MIDVGTDHVGVRNLRDLATKDDPNGWLWQICHHLRLTPEERLKKWPVNVNWTLEHNAARWQLPYVEFSPRTVLRTFTEYRVRFVLVGMGAAYLQGVPYPSLNTDMMPDPRASNTERAQAALAVLDASPLRLSRRALIQKTVGEGVTPLFTSAGMVNIVEELPGVGDYPTVHDRARVITLGGGLDVRVADLRHVIKSKETLGRLHDPVHVLMCRETLDVERRYGHRWNAS